MLRLFCVAWLLALLPLANAEVIDPIQAGSGTLDIRPIPSMSLPLNVTVISENLAPVYQVDTKLGSKVNVPVGSYCVRTLLSNRERKVCGLAVQDRQTVPVILPIAAVKFPQGFLRDPDFFPQQSLNLQITSGKDVLSFNMTPELYIPSGPVKIALIQPSTGKNLGEFNAAPADLEVVPVTGPAPKVHSELLVRREAAVLPNPDRRCMDTEDHVFVSTAPFSSYTPYYSSMRDKGLVDWDKEWPSKTMGGGYYFRKVAFKGASERSLFAADWTRNYFCVNSQCVQAANNRDIATYYQNVRRIDVNHAKYTAPDGTVTTYPGTYSVRDMRGTALYVMTCENVNLNEIPTGTGIDVLPGKYKVTIKYKTPAGDKLQIRDVDLN